MECGVAGVGLRLPFAAMYLLELREGVGRSVSILFYPQLNLTIHIILPIFGKVKCFFKIFVKIFRILGKMADLL